MTPLCNEVIQNPDSDVSSQTEVFKMANDELTETGNCNDNTSDDEYVETKYDQISRYSESFTNEVGYAAETLLRMANDVSCWSKLCDCENNFVSRNERNVRGFTEGTRKMCCFKNDDCGILSNSLATFSGVKRTRKSELGCSYCGFNHIGTCLNAEDDENEHFKMIKMKSGNDDDEKRELFTPSIHQRFSLFSIIHLLSAVRLALVFNHLTKKCKDNNLSIDHHDQYMRKIGVMWESCHFAVDEIVEKVRVRPGDPRILQSKAQLEDLIRGTLRVFSAQTSLNRVKKMKKLATYDKSRKGWSWVGPIPCLQLDPDDVSAACAPEFWGVSKKMLMKLVNCFADWFETNQNALMQRASLPPPPLTLSLSKINSQERFVNLIKSKGCSATIKPCSGEVRAYFHAEERIRHMISDRAFAYTAVDGRKSSVAPVRKCGEKVSSRARDHNLLKCDRPASITILTIVRDAAARLPGGIGTRGDVAVLVRDSQYLVEGISDEQMSQVVSGGLDRLHYERDPCVRFDKQRRLWVYLHGDRVEEEFDDDGRQSTIIRWGDRGRRV